MRLNPMNKDPYTTYRYNSQRASPAYDYSYYQHAKKSLPIPHCTSAYTQYVSRQNTTQTRPQYTAPKLACENYVNYEKLPRYIIPVLYTPKRVVTNAELHRNHITDNLYKERYVITENPSSSAPQHSLKAASSDLTHSEMLLYQNLMTNMYGIQVNKPFGDNGGSNNYSKGTEEASKYEGDYHGKKIYVEAGQINQDYTNPNYVSDSDHSSVSVSQHCAPTQSQPLQQRYPIYTRRSARTQSCNNRTNSTQSTSSPPQPNNVYKHLTTYGACYQPARNPYAQSLTVEQTQVPRSMLAATHQEELCEIDTNTKSTQTLNEERLTRSTLPATPQKELCEINLCHSPESITDTKSTQTLNEEVIATKETQTDDNRALTKTGGKTNDCSEANITVIIDRGWKEDIYSLASGSLRSDASIHSRKNPSRDLLPTVPSSSQPKSRRNVALENKENKACCEAAVNTYISFSKRKTKTKVAPC